MRVGCGKPGIAKGKSVTPFLLILNYHKRMNNSVQCPKCGSEQITAGKRGWNMSTGIIGSSNIMITCLKCGKQFKPGHDLQSNQVRQKELQVAMKSPAFWVIMAIMLSGLYWVIFIFL